MQFSVTIKNCCFAKILKVVSEKNKQPKSYQRASTFSVVSPLHVNSPPSKSCSECCKNQFIPLFQLILEIPYTQWKRAGTCISIPFYIDHYLFRRYSQALRNSSNYTHVCLMGNHPVNVLLRQVIPLHDRLTSIRHIGNSIFKDCTSFLINIMHPIVQCIVRWSTYGASRFDM